MTTTIALFSSSRRNGNTGRLMDDIAARMGIEVVDLAGKLISPYDYEHRNRGDDFEPLMDHVLGHEQIIFASPVYWYAVCPRMKVFLDRICDFFDLPDLLEKGRRLRMKRAFVVCTSVCDDVSEPFIAAFQQTFEYLGMEFGGYVHANCRNGYVPDTCAQDIRGFIDRATGPRGAPGASPDLPR